MSTKRFPCAGHRARLRHSASAGQALHAPTRREFVYGLGASVGSLALTSFLAPALHAGAPDAAPASGWPAAQKAKNCIFLMMEGGPSHIDTFDPKPKLAELHLKEFERQGRMNSAMESGKRYYVQS